MAIQSSVCNGKLRVCLNLRELNANLKRTYHRTPTMQDITHKLAGARVFSKLDAKHGCWSIVLDKKSSTLTAFNSPASNHRYKFDHLPFGINVSQDLFQEAMDKITRDLDGVFAITDDICVFGKDDDDHDANIHKLMKKAREHGLILNADKCFIKIPEINFFGMSYGKDGVKPDKCRVAEIQNLPPPSNKKELQSFLGVIQYPSTFIPRLSQQTAPLRDLLKGDPDGFSWTSTHQEVFQKLKSYISETATLQFFNPSYETRIQVDASTKGLGVALVQIDPSEPEKERIIAFASKSLSETESR